jgi:hypothetical protein
MSKLSEQPAFPRPESHYDDKRACPGSAGMILRQYYAGLAMRGLICSNKLNYPGTDGMTPEERTAKNAVEYADALIARLEKTP